MQLYMSVCESMLVAKSGQDHRDINLGEFLPKCTTSLGKARWVDSGSSFRLLLRLIGFWLVPNDFSYFIDIASPCLNDGYKLSKMLGTIETNIQL